MPALLTVISGLLVSLSGALLLRALDLGLPDGTGSLLVSGLLLVATVGVVDLVIKEIQRMRREEIRAPRSAAHMRVIALGLTGAEPQARDLLFTMRHRLGELRTDGFGMSPLIARGLSRDDSARFADIIPPHSHTPLRQVLKRGNARTLLSLTRKLWSASMSMATWPSLLPTFWTITGLWLGFAREEDRLEPDFFGLSLAGADSRLLDDSPIAPLIGSGLLAALLLAGIGLVLGSAVLALHYWVAGLVSFRLLAADRFELEQAAHELDALEHRIERARDRGLRGFWRRLLRPF